jgi:polysaccharide pyruvyl transferase CsaB
MTQISRILISGYYGCGNLGDEAILSGITQGLRRLLPQAELVVLSGAPAETAKQYGVKAIPRMAWGEIRREMRRADLFVSGGGGLLQDVTSWRSPLYYLGLIWLAKRRRLKVAVIFQGIGPLRRNWLKKLAAKILRRVELIAVRDETSARTLMALGLPESKIQIGADAVWLLEPAADNTLLPVLNPQPSPLVGVFLRPLPGRKVEETPELWEAIAQGLGGFLKNQGGRAVFIPLQKPEDLAAAEAVTKQLPLPAQLLTEDFSPPAMLGLIGQFDLVLGMRLHSLIFAAARGIPPVGISYDPKVAAALAQMGLTPAFSTTLPSAPALVEALAIAWRQREPRRVELSRLAQSNRQKAEEILAQTIRLITP